MSINVFVKIADIEPIELTFSNVADAAAVAAELMPFGAYYNQDVVSVVDSDGRTLRTRFDAVTCVLINSGELETSRG